MHDSKNRTRELMYLKYMRILFIFKVSLNFNNYVLLFHNHLNEFNHFLINFQSLNLLLKD